MYVNLGALMGGIEFSQQSVEVPEALRSPGMFERLVLGQDVDEALADLVAMSAE